MNIQKTIKFLVPTAAALACAGLWIGLHHQTPKPTATRPRLYNEFPNVPRPAEADRAYASNPNVAKQKYKAFVSEYAKAKDPVVQDQVGTARVKIGYLAAHQKDWAGARKAFLAADHETKGTGDRGDFGSINEEGAYQAIVCLQASGKTEEARAQYQAYIRRRPLSPLCMACYHRLVRLNGGKPTTELDNLIQFATTKQDDRAKFESSVCGPRTLVYLCEIGAIKPGSVPHDYESLAKFCHTKDSGTSIEWMVEGLKALGVQPAPFRVDRQDLRKIKTPAIILWADHYLALLQVGDKDMTVYDTLAHSRRTLALPALDDPDFFVNAILLSGTL